MPNVSIPIPAGMDEAKVKEAFAKFQKNTIEAKAKDLANRSAIKQLIANHKAEYDKLIAEAKTSV